MSQGTLQQPQIRILQDSVLMHSPNEGAASDSQAEGDPDQRKPPSRGSLAALHGNHPLPPLPRTTSPGIQGSPSPPIGNQGNRPNSYHSTQYQYHSSRQPTQRPQSSDSVGPSVIDRSGGLAGIGSRSNVAISSLGAGMGIPTSSHGPGMTSNPQDETRPGTAVGLTTAASHPTLDRSRTLNSVNPRSGVDWLIPLDDKVRAPTPVYCPTTCLTDASLPVKEPLEKDLTLPWKQPERNAINMPSKPR